MKRHAPGVFVTSHAANLKKEGTEHPGLDDVDVADQFGRGVCALPGQQIARKL